MTNSQAASSCFPPTRTGFVTVTGIITATAAGKGLGYTTTAQLAWISDVNAGNSFVPGTGMQLYFSSSVTNSVSRGDYVTVVGYLTSSSGSITLEVCATPTPVSCGGSCPTLSAKYVGTANTALFTQPGVTYNTVVGTTFQAYNATFQAPGGACLSTTKPLFDGSLVTITGATLLRCSNPTSMLLAASSGKVANYGVCNPSLTPLADTYTGSLCNTCFYDKYSQFWISTDNGATALMVSSQLFRTFATYTMTVGATMSITGVLTYYGPANGGAAMWALTPRDLNDISGLTLLPANANYPTAVIGDSTSGVKQQQYMWASPGPSLSSTLDPSGVTAAGNLPLGMPANVLGPQDVINNAGTTLQGSGVYFPALASASGIPGAPGWPVWNTCPNASGFTWIYARGSTTQNLCGCYPPRFYSPRLGSNGGGTSYVQVRGIVNFIEGVTGTSGVGSFYMQSGCGPNQAVYVYQDKAAGKLVTIGDDVTITAQAYSYYGLVEMQNTINVVVNAHNAAVCPPITLSSLAVLDVTTQGVCSASTVLFRANRVTIQNVRVTKVAMYEPWPLNYNYWYNGTQIGAPYSALFNSTIGANSIGSWGPGTIYNVTSGKATCAAGGVCVNWFNANPAAYTDGTAVLHPQTGNTFIATFEVTDADGNSVLVDQCPYGSNGGLVKAFLGTDGVSTPLAVGDTFQSITGILKYSRGGTYRNSATGGNLMLCATSDPNLLVGRNQPFASLAGTYSVPATTTLGGISGSQFSSTPLIRAAFKIGVAAAANVTYGAVNITTVTDASTRRRLLGAAVTVAYSVQTTAASGLSAPLSAGSLSAALSTSFASYGLAAPTVSSASASAPVSLLPVNATTVVKTNTDDSKGIQLGVGLGVGLGGGLVLILVALYFKVLRKKNIETGQKSAVMMTPAIISQAPIESSGR